MARPRSEIGGSDGGGRSPPSLVPSHELQELHGAVCERSRARAAQLSQGLDEVRRLQGAVKPSLEVNDRRGEDHTAKSPCGLVGVEISKQSLGVGSSCNHVAKRASEHIGG
jgi:hypothetical protein